MILATSETAVGGWRSEAGPYQKQNMSPYLKNKLKAKMAGGMAQVVKH
jgi:hypothetical protein